MESLSQKHVVLKFWYAAAFVVTELQYKLHYSISDLQHDFVLNVYLLLLYFAVSYVLINVMNL
jgi:hypothetical protein